MKFPPIPGKTPREQFENLVRQVISVPKAELDKGRRKRKRPKKHPDDE